MRLSVSLQGDLCFPGTDGKDAPQSQSLGMTCFLSGRDRGTDVNRLPGLQVLYSSLAGAVAAEGAPGLAAWRGMALELRSRGILLRMLKRGGGSLGQKPYLENTNGHGSWPGPGGKAAFWSFLRKH